MESVKLFMEKYTDVPAMEWAAIRNRFTPLQFVKNEIILEEGAICRHFYFLDEGLVRFYVNHDGQDVTTFFVEAPYCFTSKDSFHGHIPATENIQALSDVKVWRATHPQVQELSAFPSWNRFSHKIIHEIQRYTEQLMMANKLLTAEERYRMLLEKHPDATQRIPLKYLAGFLGVAPQSLSRIRLKFQKKSAE